MGGNPVDVAAALVSDARGAGNNRSLAERTTTLREKKPGGAPAFIMGSWKRWLALNATELKLAALIVGVLLAGLFAGSAGAWQRP
jgi:hypothetical protein